MESLDRPDLLRALLRAPWRVTNVDARRFPARFATADAVIVTHRLILVTEGGIDYTVEGETRRVGAGEVLWVSAWCRRRWRVAGRGAAGLCWCEFATDPVVVPPGLHVARAEVGAGLEKMKDLWPAREAMEGLRLEAAAKALAAEFWSRAELAAGAEAGEPRHPEVRRAVAWLERNFGRADALAAFYGTLALSPNHFRLLFRRQTGETVQGMLARLRLRRARYLVVETTRSMKEVAAESGYDDPLYFSQHYRRFWGRPPSAEREAWRPEA